MATLVSRPVSAKKRADDIFFTAMSVLILMIVIVGFAPSYFLKGAIVAHLPSLLVHLHGAVNTAWIILFVIQTSLVSAGNVRLHRKLGVLGCVIAGLMVILGALTSFGTLRRGAQLPPIFTPTSFLIGNVLGILFFGCFVAFAVWKRNRPAVHKRIMFIANVSILEPALDRMISFIPLFAHYPFLAGVIPLALIVALFIFDLFTWKKPLAATVVGGFLYWVAGPVSNWIIATPLAQQITVWAQHHP